MVPILSFACFALSLASFGFSVICSRGLVWESPQKSRLIGAEARSEIWLAAIYFLLVSAFFALIGHIISV